MKKGAAAAEAKNQKELNKKKVNKKTKKIISFSELITNLAQCTEKQEDQTLFLGL